MCDFFLFHMEIEGKGGWIIGGGGGGKGYVAPSQIIGGRGAGPLLHTPILYVTFDFDTCVYVCNVIQIK